MISSFLEVGWNSRHLYRQAEIKADWIFLVSRLYNPLTILVHHGREKIVEYQVRVVEPQASECDHCYT